MVFNQTLIEIHKCILCKIKKMASPPDTENTSWGGNTKPPSSMRRVCFTMNNYSETTWNTWIQRLSEFKVVMGKEVGESGTPHIQGYVEFPKPKKFSTVKNLLPGAHLEKARGSRQDNITYCTKEGNETFSNFPIPLKQQVLCEYIGIQWYEWQQKIIDLYHTVPDKRKIHWFVDPVGNHGKSFLTRFMVLKYGVLLAGAKKADVFYQVQKRLEDENDEDAFRMVILDIPRHNEAFINYGVLESLKDGIILSTKYEGGTFVFPVPHVVVMANIPPDMSKFSLDRWDITEL